MELQFKLSSGENCYFDVDNLSVTGDDIVYDDIALYIDGEPYDQSSTTWSGHNLSDGEIFEIVLNAYLRKDTSEYKGFSKNWNVVDALFDNMEYDGSSKVITVLPIVEFDEVVLYDLNLETPEFKFYSHDDSFKVFNKDWGLVTDYENFYASALDEEIESIQNGETKCIYMSDDIQDYIENEFDDEDF